jgi:hypothetical protein
LFDFKFLLNKYRVLIRLNNSIHEIEQVMSTVKIKVNEESVKQFLETKYNDDIKNINFIRGGQLSQAIYYNV